MSGLNNAKPTSTSAARRSPHSSSLGSATSSPRLHHYGLTEISTGHLWLLGHTITRHTLKTLGEDPSILTFSKAHMDGRPWYGGITSNQGSAPSGCEAGNSHKRRIMNQGKEVMVSDQFHKNNRTVSKPLRSIKRTGGKKQSFKLLAIVLVFPVPFSFALNNSSVITRSR
jgi:hypothetical protein